MTEVTINLTTISSYAQIYSLTPHKPLPPLLFIMWFIITAAVSIYVVLPGIRHVEEAVTRGAHKFPLITPQFMALEHKALGVIKRMWNGKLICYEITAATLLYNNVIFYCM